MRYFIIWLVINFVTAYDWTCPHRGQWELRARAEKCSNIENYVCLFDAVQLKFDDKCIGPHEERKGTKPVLNIGNFNRIPCSPTHYQPLKFFSFGNTNCTHFKSPCSEEGQVIADNGTSVSDRSCRCDYLQGYAFVVNTSLPCSCIPSKEDCTCYLKTCMAHEVLSPDYECVNMVNEANSQGVYKCSTISRTESYKPVTDIVTLNGSVAIVKKYVAVGCLIVFIIGLVCLLLCVCYWEETKIQILYSWTSVRYYFTKVKIIKGMTDQHFIEGQTVTMTCEINEENIPGQWRKDGKELKSDESFSITVDGKIHKLIIHSAAVSDSGHYSFCLKDKASSSNLIVEKEVNIIKPLKNQACLEGETVTFTFEISEENIPVQWKKDRVELKSSEPRRITAVGRIHKLVIQSATVFDNGHYSCHIKHKDSTSKLTVKQVIINKPLEDQHCIEGQTVTMICEINIENIPGQWRKDGKELKSDESLSITVDGKIHKLIIQKFCNNDRGYYLFKVSDKTSSGHLFLDFDSDEKNYVRLCHLLKTEAEPVVRMIFNREIHENQLKRILNTDKNRKQISWLRNEKHINRREYDLLYPRVVEYSVIFMIKEYDYNCIKDKEVEMQLRAKIEDDVSNLYYSVEGTHKVEVAELEPGSLIVVLKLTSSQFSNENILKQTIESAVAEGKVGSFKTDVSGFQFKRRGNVPVSIKSEDFDIRLMMILMKNLIDFNIKADTIPHNNDHSVVADLSRIRYLRNKLVQNSDRSISDEDFDEYWNHLSEALIQLGGESFKQKCIDLKHFNPTPLQCQDYLHPENLLSEQGSTSIETATVTDEFFQERNMHKLAKNIVKKKFDMQFPPSRLKGDIDGLKNQLQTLKEQRVITPSQWEDLFPTDKDSPCSSARFDIKVMIILLRFTSFKDKDIFKVIENLQNHLSRPDYDKRAVQQAIKDIKEEG